MENKVDILRPLLVVLDEVLVPWWSLLLRITRQHALETDTDTFYIMYRRPTLTVEEVQAYNTVRVNVRVPWDWVLVVFNEYNLRGLKQMVSVEKDKERGGIYFDWVGLAEHKFESVYFVLVERI